MPEPQFVGAHSVPAGLLAGREEAINSRAAWAFIPLAQNLEDKFAAPCPFVPAALGARAQPKRSRGAGNRFVYRHAALLTQLRAVLTYIADLAGQHAP
jgi:hypothetical protein